MTPDGLEMYFCMAAPGYRYAVILVTRYIDGAWTEPVVAPFSGSTGWMDLEPFISPDGNRFFFMSTRPDAGEEAGEADIWVMDRQGDGWGEPWNLGAPVNSDRAEYFPAATRDGTLYFTRADSTGRVHRIYRSRLAAGLYQEPELLPEEVNCGVNRFNATISPDESRLILSAVGVPGSHGTVDYFLVRRNADDSWSGPLNLGPVINDGSGQSWSPYVTPGGETFLFMSSRRTGPAPAWPPTWGDLQAGHRTAGGGNPNIFQVRADFLDSLTVGSHPPALSDTSSPDPRAAAAVAFPDLSGPYLGQEPPGVNPVLFAPGIVSTGLNERDLVVSVDGGTIWYGFMGQGLVSIMETRLEDGRWTEPAPVPFHLDEDFACFEPALSADGHTALFLSNRAAPGQEQGRGWANQNIFSSRLVDGAWSEPAVLPAPVTTDAAEYFPSLAADGTLYFSREDEQGHAAIWAAERVGDGFAEPRRLPAAINVGEANYNATVAPDESWIIVCVDGHPENQGDSDYWISFREEGKGWRPAVNLGDPFNGAGLRASSVSLSPDGRHLFFSTNRSITENFFPNDRITRTGLLALHSSPGNGSTDIWWVDIDVLDKLR
jgi:Tol biopolymer transport system component